MVCRDSLLFCIITPFLFPDTCRSCYVNIQCDECSFSPGLLLELAGRINMEKIPVLMDFITTPGEVREGLGRRNEISRRQRSS